MSLKCVKYLEEYFDCGGFPESLLITDSSTRTRYLQNLAETVVFRDVIRRYDLPNPEAVWRQMHLLLGLMASPMSYAKLRKRLQGEQYRVSPEMVKDVTGYFADAYLIYEVEIFSLNISVRRTNPKKVYCADHRLALSMSGILTHDVGKSLENIIFLHLRRKTDRVFYAKTKEGYEVDFVTLPMGASLDDVTELELVQVCVDYEDEVTQKRELRALVSAMGEYGKNESVIVTQNTEDEIQTEAGTIKVVPAWKYLLED